MSDTPRILLREPAAEPRNELSPRALLTVLRRRLPYIVIPTVLLAGGVAAVAWWLPARYRANVLIAVEQVVMRDVQQGPAPEPDMQQQLGRVNGILNQPSFLESVVREAGRAPGAAVHDAQLTAMRAHITVEAQGPRTLSVAYEDGDSRQAARVAAALGRRLVAESLAQEEASSQDAVDLIQRQLAAVKARAATREAAIAAYKQRWFGELPEQTAATVELLKGAEQRLQETSLALADQESRLIAAGSEIGELENQGLAKRPEQARLDQLRANLARLRRQYTDEHPEVVQLKSEIARLQQSLGDDPAAAATGGEPSPARLRYLQLAADRQALQQRVERLRQDREQLGREVAALSGRMQAAPRHEMELAAMTHEDELARNQQQQLTEDLRVARQQGERQGVLRVLEEPRVPTQPVAPRRLRLALLGLLAGLGLGVALAFMAQQADTSFRSMEDFEAPSAPPVLAEIPAIASRGERLLLPARAGDRPALLDEPIGAATEQFRILAAKLIRRSGGQRAMSLLLTSAGAGEGKTLAAIHLALAMAQLEKQRSVLLVDADPGRPSVHRLLRLSPGPGLAGLLTAPEDDLAKYVRSQRGIHVLDAGAFTRESRAALASGAADRVFARLRQRFAYLVVDAPPILAIAEGFILQHLVDTIVLVVRAGMTPRIMVERALRNLDRSRVAGVVLNDVEASPLVYSYPYRGQDEPWAAAGGKESW
jgi:polysaccharide biosynthesis transport protein